MFKILILGSLLLFGSCKEDREIIKEVVKEQKNDNKNNQEQGDTVTYEPVFSEYGECSALPCDGTGIQERTLDSCEIYLNGELIGATDDISKCSDHNESLTQSCDSPAGSIEEVINNGSQTYSCLEGETAKSYETTTCDEGFQEEERLCVEAEEVFFSTTELTNNCSIDFYNSSPDEFSSTFPSLNMTNVNDIEFVSAKGIYSNQSSYAALMEDGSLEVWGRESNGGLQSDVDAKNFNNTDNKIKEISVDRSSGYSVLMEDGSVEVWGSLSQSEVDNKDFGMEGSIIKEIYPSGSYAALMEDGSVEVWGNFLSDDQPDVDAKNFNNADNKIKQIYSSSLSYSALMEDGSVEVWGRDFLFTLGTVGQDEIDAKGFNNTDNKIKQIYSTDSGSYAALMEDGSVESWGKIGDADKSSLELKNFNNVNNKIKQIYSTRTKFIALMEDGTIEIWGGSDEVSLGSPGDKVKQVYTTSDAIAILMEDGSVRVWGDEEDGGSQSDVDIKEFNNVDPHNTIKEIYPNRSSFAALMEDGSVEVWGRNGYGGNQDNVVPKNFNNTDNKIKEIYPNFNSYAALMEDGSVEVWGDADSGGDQSVVDSKLFGSSGKKIDYATEGCFIKECADGYTFGNLDEYGRPLSCVLE